MVETLSVGAQAEDSTALTSSPQTSQQVSSRPTVSKEEKTAEADQILQRSQEMQKQYGSSSFDVSRLSDAELAELLGAGEDVNDPKKSKEDRAADARKVFRNISLRQHPDKNPDSEEKAKEVMQVLSVVNEELQARIKGEKSQVKAVAPIVQANKPTEIFTKPESLDKKMESQQNYIPQPRGDDLAESENQPEKRKRKRKNKDEPKPLSKIFADLADKVIFPFSLLFDLISTVCAIGEAIAEISAQAIRGVVYDEVDPVKEREEERKVGQEKKQSFESEKQTEKQKQVEGFSSSKNTSQDLVSVSNEHRDAIRSATSALISAGAVTDLGSDEPVSSGLARQTAATAGKSGGR